MHCATSTYVAQQLLRVCCSLLRLLGCAFLAASDQQITVVVCKHKDDIQPALMHTRVVDACCKLRLHSTMQPQPSEQRRHAPFERDIPLHTQRAFSRHMHVHELTLLAVWHMNLHAHTHGAPLHTLHAASSKLLNTTPS